MSKTGTKLSLKNNGFVLLMSSIMASDSPTSDHKENVFNYTTPGRSTPPPTTSYLPARNETTQTQPVGDSSAVQEPNKEEKEKEAKDELEFSSPDANPGYKPDQDAKLAKKDFKDDKKEDSKNLNGGDKLDGQWMRPLDSKPNSDDEDESCTVNCLYYTIQCCECTIT